MREKDDKMEDGEEDEEEYFAPSKCLATQILMTKGE